MIAVLLQNLKIVVLLDWSHEFFDFYIGVVTMRNITLKNVWKSFAGKTVLSGINLSLSEGDCLALIGENGAGKSTLLKILCSEIISDSGEFFGLENGCSYIAQDFSGEAEETPYQFLQRKVSKLNKAIRLLEESGFTVGKSQERLHNVCCGVLSGGEQKKLELVAGISSGSVFLAIDEPENHLDYQSIEWLIDVLRSFRGGIIFVSHDQYFIDQLANSILELEEGTGTVYSMKYAEYLAEKERQIAGEARQWKMEEKTIARLRKTVEMMKNRAQRSSDTAATYQQTKRRLQEMRESHGSKPTIDVDKPKAKLSSVDQKQGKIIASIQNLGFSYGKARVFRAATADLRFGEKVIIFGSNGSGKSTLINLLVGNLTPQEGTIAIGQNVRWQYMTQDHLAGIDASKSAFDVFQETLAWPEARCRSYLAKYSIRADSALRPLRDLSGGQQARFKLALTFAQDPEFLILDEPTNHVDPATWDAIVEAVDGYSGTVLAVTHDRSFIDAIAKKLWIIESGTIKIELGNLSDYLGKEQ